MNELLESRLKIFPISSELVGSQDSSQLYIGGCSLTALAEEFDTPLYVIDQATLDSNLAGYRRALQANYPAASGITYAGTWEEIVLQMKMDDRDGIGSSLQEYMERVARRSRDRMGAVIPVSDAQSFVEGIAATGLIDILR